MTSQRNVTGMAPGSSDDDCVIPVPEWCKRVGISHMTWKRMRKAGEGPKITRLSARRVGIRNRHSREWLDSRVEQSAT
jgi:predicted DNA-binding transcriptional regulator AlpA